MLRLRKSTLVAIWGIMNMVLLLGMMTMPAWIHLLGLETQEREGLGFLLASLYFGYGGVIFIGSVIAARADAKARRLAGQNELRSDVDAGVWYPETDTPPAKRRRSHRPDH